MGSLILAWGLWLACTAVVAQDATVTLYQGVPYVGTQMNGSFLTFTMPWTYRAQLPGGATAFCVGIQICPGYTAPVVARTVGQLPTPANATCTLFNQQCGGSHACVTDGTDEVCTGMSVLDCTTKVNTWCTGSNLGIKFIPNTKFYVGTQLEGDNTVYAVQSDLPQGPPGTNVTSCDYMSQLNLCPTPSYSISSDWIVHVSYGADARAFVAYEVLHPFLAAVRLLFNDPSVFVDVDKVHWNGGAVVDVYMQLLANSQDAHDAAVLKLKSALTIGGYAITGVDENEQKRTWVIPLVLVLVSVVVVGALVALVLFRRRHRRTRDGYSNI